MAGSITWNDTIKGQFDDFDIEHMKQITGNALKLDDYDSVKTWAGQILNQVQNGFMPPGAPWDPSLVQNFQTWMDNGMPEGSAGGSTGGAGSGGSVGGGAGSGGGASGSGAGSSGGGSGSGSGRPTPGGGGSGGAVTWTGIIKAQFTQFDIDHMQQVTGGDINLGDYDSVKSNGPDVYNMVSRKRMPPGNPWSDQNIQNFKAWMDAGYPES